MTIAGMSLAAGLSAAEFNVRDFGAVGDGVHDDAPAFEKALQAIKESEAPNTLIVPKGTYYMEPTSENPVGDGHFNIVSEKDLTVQGEDGTMILCGSNFHHGLVVTNSENVRVESIAVDFKSLPFTQGTVVAVNAKEKYIDVKIDEGYPSVSDRHMNEKGTKNRIYFFNKGTTLRKDEFFDQYVEGLKDLGNGVARIKTRNPILDEYVGTRCAMVGRRKANAFDFDNSKDCTGYKLAVYSAPALGYCIRNCDNITLDSSKITQKPGTNRLMSCNADGVHTKWGTKGPTVINCWFEGMGDDSVNIGGTYQKIYTQPDARTLVVVLHKSLEPNDQIQWVRYSTGDMIPLPECTDIKRVNWEGEGAFQLTFAEDLPANIQTVDKVGDHGDMVINMNKVPQNSVIRNNFFGRHRMRGVLMRAPNGIIENNRFEDLRGPGIQLGHHYHGRVEGPNGAGTVIRNNTFINIRTANIVLSDGNKDGDEPQRSIKDIVIADNRFVLFGLPVNPDNGKMGIAIWINNAENLLIEDNFIDVPNPDDMKTDLVTIAQAANVDIKNTIINGTPIPAEDWLTISDSADKATVTVEQP